VAHLAFDVFPTRSSARKAVHRGEVLLDGARAETSRWVQAGQELTLCEPAACRPVYVIPQLEVVYEDEAMAVVVKPPGITVNGNRHRTLEHALPPFLSASPHPDALRAPRPAHRIDGPTGGLVAVAKTASALAGLSEAFHHRTVRKRYEALAVGRLDGTGSISEPIDGRAAHTTWEARAHARTLKTDWVTWVSLSPHTGRTHQLRRHLAHLGTPVLGDREYARDGLLYRGKGLFLWAVGLRLPHPLSGDPVDVKIEAPPKFAAFMARQQRRWERHRGPDADPQKGDASPDP
jgi:RluA family pseudouridine synthase